LAVQWCVTSVAPATAPSYLQAHPTATPEKTIKPLSPASHSTSQNEANEERGGRRSQNEIAGKCKDRIIIWGAENVSGIHLRRCLWTSPESAPRTSHWHGPQSHQAAAPGIVAGRIPTPPAGQRNPPLLTPGTRIEVVAPGGEVGLCDRPPGLLGGRLRCRRRPRRRRCGAAGGTDGRGGSIAMGGQGRLTPLLSLP